LTFRYEEAAKRISRELLYDNGQSALIRRFIRWIRRRGQQIVSCNAGDCAQHALASRASGAYVELQDFDLKKSLSGNQQCSN